MTSKTLDWQGLILTTYTQLSTLWVGQSGLSKYELIQAKSMMMSRLTKNQPRWLVYEDRPVRRHSQ
jgi:hypothetical protein